MVNRRSIFFAFYKNRSKAWLDSTKNKRSNCFIFL